MCCIRRRLWTGVTRVFDELCCTTEDRVAYVCSELLITGTTLVGLGTRDTVGDSSVAATLPTRGRMVGHAIFASGATTSPAACAIAAIVVVAITNRNARPINICNCRPIDRLFEI